MWFAVPSTILIFIHSLLIAPTDPGTNTNLTPSSPSKPGSSQGAAL